MNDNSGSVQSALIVEENPQQRRILVGLVQDLGLAYVEASSGDEAIAQIEHALPSIIIVNLTTPDADCLVAHDIRQTIPALAGIPIIALSAYDCSTLDWRGLRGIFPIGDTQRYSSDDLRALIMGALKSSF